MEVVETGLDSDAYFHHNISYPNILYYFYLISIITISILTYNGHTKSYSVERRKATGYNIPTIPNTPMTSVVQLKVELCGL